MTLDNRDRRQPRYQGALRAAMLGVAAVAAVGCGSSSTPESTVVAPPSPEVVSEVDTDTEPPGGLEMPAVEISDPPVETSDPGAGGLEMPANAEIPEPSGASLQPSLRFGTWEEIQAFARSNGRITVVDLWSLSCEPCLKEFPALVRLHREFGASVQCIAVNLDYDGRKSRPPEHYQPRIAEFLRSVGAAGFPTYISQTPSDDVYAAEDLTSIPAVMVFDAEGEPVKVFVDAGDTLGFTYEADVQPLVAGLAG